MSVHAVRRGLAALSLVAGTIASVTDARADVVHQVRQGETLASIAQRYYGDPAREATLVAANVLGAQANASLLPGMRIVIPSVGYYRAETGDTWQRVAQRELGSAARSPYLARVNGADARIPPSPGAVLRIPYLLRYVVLDEEPLFEIARRFYGDRTQVQFILQFNRLSSSRLQRGQTLLLPLPELTLREEPVCESSASLAAVSAAQRRVDAEIPAVRGLVARGQFVEAVALGARVLAAPEINATQRSEVDRALAEAYCALDRTDLAAEAFRDALTANPAFRPDPVDTPPKVLDAFGLASGIGPVRSVSPAPPSARPDEAH